VVLARTPFELDEYRQTVEKVLGDLRLSLSTEKTRTTTFDQYFRFLGAEVQGNNILLPFEKMKTPKVPYYVAPVMPPALVHAYRLGHFKATGPLEWTGARRERKEPAETTPAMPQKPVLWLLSGVKTEGNHEGATADVLAQLAGLLADGRLEIPIAKVYPLAEVRDAYRELDQRHTRGKIVLEP